MFSVLEHVCFPGPESDAAQSRYGM
jgi:hypothetical protein